MIIIIPIFIPIFMQFHIIKLILYFIISMYSHKRINTNNTNNIYVTYVMSAEGGYIQSIYESTSSETSETSNSSDSSDSDDDTLQQLYEYFLPNEEEREQMIDDTLDMLEEVIEDIVLQYKNPDFTIHHIVDSHLCVLFEHITGSEICDTFISYHIDNYINDLANDIIHRFYTEIAPPRSYETTFIRKLPNEDKIRRKLEYLTHLPQPEQRTPEWYAYRHTLITASAASKAFGTPSSVNQLIYEKCEEFNPATRQNQFVNTNSPLHWGQKYEPITAALYEKRNNTRIADFGCIQHPKYPFLGASPDGINNDPISPLYGRMLEIKNIVNREITGIPKEEYWVQMQLQMEVCNLNECDFLETRIKEYEDEAAFFEDSPEIDDITQINSYTHTASGNEKGIILWFQHPSISAPLYEYAPIGATKEEFEEWEEKTFEKHALKGSIWNKNIYWHLDQYSCVLVLRNKRWFSKAIEVLANVWSTIEAEKVSGFQHRAPKKRSATTGDAKALLLANESAAALKALMLSMETFDVEHEDVVCGDSNNIVENDHNSLIEDPSSTISIPVINDKCQNILQETTTTTTPCIPIKIESLEINLDIVKNLPLTKPKKVEILYETNQDSAA